MRRSVWLAVLVLLVAFPASAVEMAAHRAVYRLALASARGEVIGASGMMAYEMVDACDGWAVRQRLRLNVTNRDSQEIEMGSDYATFESKDGLSMRFTMRQTTEQAVSLETDGNASLARAGGDGEAHYSKPREALKKLPPGTLFPTAHTEAIIAAARTGKKIITVPLLDGTVASGAQDTSVSIFSWDVPAANRFPELAALASTRVRIAFFDRESGAATPEYEVGMRYWENGIADEMLMDFGDFAVRATLEELVVLPKSC